MNSDQEIWLIWAESLHGRGWNQAAAALLDAAGPLTLLGAQIIYLTQPILQSVISLRHLEVFAQLLEDPLQSREFIQMLKRG